MIKSVSLKENRRAGQRCLISIAAVFQQINNDLFLMYTISKWVLVMIELLNGDFDGCVECVVPTVLAA